jgi:hypothetical protein
MPPAKAGEVTIIMIAALKSSFFMTLSLEPRPRIVLGHKHGAASTPTGLFVARRQLATRCGQFRSTMPRHLIIDRG